MKATTGLTLAAGLLAGLWIDTMRRSAKAERRHPPQGRFIDAGGVQLHVIERGAGQPVVFIHGAGALTEDMALSVLDQAGERWHAVAMDRPGSGYSERPWGSLTPTRQARILHDGLVAMNLRKPIIVGHSLGGAVALAYALEFPEDIGGLVFLAGYCYPTPRVDFVPFMAPAVPVAGQVLSRTVLQPIDRALLPLMIRWLFAPNPVPPSFRAMPIELILRPAQLEATAADLAALFPAVAAMAPRYHQISCPTAILAGEEDHIIDPHAHAVRLHEEIPGSTLHLLAGTGHMLHHIRPEAVLAAIERVSRAAVADRVQAERTPA